MSSGRVAVALNPVLVGVPDDRLGGRADDQFLIQLRLGIDDDHFLAGPARIIDRLEPVVRDDRAFLGEPLGHLFLFGEEALGNEQREVGVDVAGVLEHAIEGPLHFLPKGVAGRLDDHAPADVGVLGQPGLLDDVDVPLGIILGAGRDLFGHVRSF